MFWTPPTSVVCLRTAETVIRCRAARRERRSRARSGAAARHHLPAGGRRRGRRATRRSRRTSASRPMRTTSPRRGVGKSRGTPIAAARSVIESGRMRLPVSIADSPSATGQVERHDEEDAGLHEVLEQEHRQPALELLVPSKARRTSGSPPCASTRSSQRKKIQSTKRPPSISQITGESPGPARAAGARLDPAPLARAEDAEDEQPEPECGEPRADEVELRLLGSPANRRFAVRARGSRSTTTTSPAKTQRQEKYVVAKPPISGPTATATAPAAATIPYAAGRRTGREVRGDEGDDRGQDQRRPHALEERPAEQQHREIRAKRGRQRAAAVDHRSRSRTPACAR